MICRCAICYSINNGFKREAEGAKEGCISISIILRRCPPGFTRLSTPRMVFGDEKKVTILRGSLDGVDESAIGIEINNARY